jgi:hypothetical protein
LSGDGTPHSLYWTTVPFSDSDIGDIVTSSNSGLLVSFKRHGMPGASIAQFPAAYTVKFTSGLRISFGAEKCASDAVLTQYMINITAYPSGKPWMVLLIAQKWRDVETGEITVVPSPTYPEGIDPYSANADIPRNGVQSP